MGNNVNDQVGNNGNVDTGATYSSRPRPGLAEAGVPVLMSLDHVVVQGPMRQSDRVHRVIAVGIPSLRSFISSKPVSTDL